MGHVTSAAAGRRARIRRAAALLWSGAADPDGGGLLLRGREFQPLAASDVDPMVLRAVLRLARLAEQIAGGMHDCPDGLARRSAAIVAARAHPVRAAFDG